MMGGSGSGQWYRWDSKKTTESQYKIDIRWMKKQNLLQPGTTGNLSWSCRGEETGSIGFRVRADQLALNYRNRQNGGEWESIEDELFFTWTPCNYGGRRQWFRCPDCRRRIAVVYGGKYFRCRHCHNLTYSSQQESLPFRLTNKAQKIRERLGASLITDEPITYKPKGMHQKTFARLKNAADQASAEAWVIMGQRYGC